MRTFVTALTALSFSITLTAADPMYGTWKMNAAKSNIKCRDIASVTMKIVKTGPGTYRNISDSIASSGQAQHQESDRYLDGKDHPVPGRPGATQAIQRVNEFTHTITNKMNGKIVSTTTATISADGKVQTNHYKTDSCEETMVFDKQ